MWYRAEMIVGSGVDLIEIERIAETLARYGDRFCRRVYLPGDAAALANDPLLASLPEDRRATLIAARGPDGSLLWDVRLQGEGETVFLEFDGGAIEPLDA